MSREIKFRMWDKENGIMIDGDSLAFEEYAPISQLLSQEGIMQYTGLKDKNGTEVYEGDVIHIQHPFRGREYIGPIVYEGNRFTAIDYYFTHQDDPGNPFESIDYMEVIGHVYEITDLLGASASDPTESAE